MMALELLRPFVETKSWDYCIVWQFGDDPSRYIKWIGCCCIGSKGVCKNVKEEIDHDHFPQLCRDAYIKHSLYTNACEKLAMVPFYLPLYSGIHGEVAMSAQPSWNHQDSVGTQVLIPVNGGLIELYRSKQVPKDQEMIETIMAQFNIFSQQMMVHLKTEGLLNGSNPWSENSSLVSVGSTRVSPTQSIDKPKTRQKNGQEEYLSKNLMTERNRRNRIKDGLFTLRALVPKISKMDRISILGDAAEYIKELQTNVQGLEDEVKRLDDDDSKSHVDEVEICKPKRSYQQQSTLKGHSRRSTSSCRKPEKVEVEVHQIGAKDFLLKLTCCQKRGGFQRLMEIVNSLGLQVLDVNVTTCYGRVLNILKVEAKGKGIAAKSLREVLLDSWMSSILQENPTRSG